MAVISLLPIAVLAVFAAPPVYAALDLTPFATLAASALSGGLVYGITQYKRTPAEVESISVATLSNALERLRIEMTYKDRTMDECFNENAELRKRLATLEALLQQKEEQHGNEG